MAKTDFSAMTDTQLVRGAQAGKDGYFDALYHRYKGEVFGLAYVILHNARDAEEVRQEVFVAVQRYLNRYDPDRSSFRTWLYRLARCRIFNRRRDRGVAARKFSRIEDVPEKLLPTGDGPPAILARRQFEDRVWSMVMSLPKKQREAVVMFYYDGLSKTEIGRRLGVTEHAVRRTLAGAGERLRLLLADLAPKRQTAEQV